MKAARDYPILTVTAKGTRWLESGHPWVYDSDVAREPDESECENGALVDVVSEKGKYLGTGFLSRLSKLRVRIVSRNANASTKASGGGACATPGTTARRSWTGRPAAAA